MDVTTCVLVGSFRCFGETFFLALRGHASELQVEAAGFSEILVTSYLTLLHHKAKRNIFTLLRTPILQDLENLQQIFLCGLFNNVITTSSYIALNYTDLCGSGIFVTEVITGDWVT
jgi:hypothetical protein